MEGEVPREVNTGTHRGRELASGAPLDAPGGTGSGCSQHKEEAVGDCGRRGDLAAVIMWPEDCSLG